MSENSTFALTRRCPACGALPGHPCKGKAGQARVTYHAERHVQRRPARTSRGIQGGYGTSPYMPKLRDRTRYTL
jgi:hypothetical protein